jgi:hypothetical protein
VLLLALGYEGPSASDPTEERIQFASPANAIGNPDSSRRRDSLPRIHVAQGHSLIQAAPFGRLSNVRSLQAEDRIVPIAQGG